MRKTFIIVVLCLLFLSACAPKESVIDPIEDTPSVQLPETPAPQKSATPTPAPKKSTTPAPAPQRTQTPYPTVEMIGNINESVSWGTVIPAGDWIYYINADDCENIYRIKTDGTENTKLSDLYCNDFKVADGWICFHGIFNNDYSTGDRDDEYAYYCLYKMRLDGNEFTKIPLEHQGKFEIVNDSIYYMGREDCHTEAGWSRPKYSVCKMNLDGSGQTELTPDFSANYVTRWYDNGIGPVSFQISDGFIYYFVEKYSDASQQCEGADVYRMTMDGSQNKKIFELNGDAAYNDAIVWGDWLYYKNDSDDNKLYKIKIDGSDNIKLNDDYTDYINVAGDWIYYSNLDDGNQTYRIRTDGTGREVVQ